MDIINDFSPILEKYETNQVNECPWKRIVSVIDTSGSTNNSYSRTRFGVRGKSETQPSLEHQSTKPILIAELEGSAIVLTMLANYFNINNCKYEVYDFSSNVIKSFSETVGGKRLYEIGSKLNTHVCPQFMSTNTLKAFQSIFSDCTTGPTLVIFASDGQPTDGGSKSDVLQFLKNYTENNHVDIITIGAGSIMTENGNALARVFRRAETLTNVSSVPRTSNSSECDKDFLTDIVELSSSVGAYLPACRDYSDLRREMSEFISAVTTDNKQKALWYVQLDAGMISLGDYVSSMLSEIDQGCSFLFTGNHGTYLFVKESNMSAYQIKVQNVTDAEKYVVTRTPFSFPFEDRQYNYSEVVLCCANSRTIELGLELTDYGYAKYRKISCRLRTA